MPVSFHWSFATQSIDFIEFFRVLLHLFFFNYLFNNRIVYMLSIYCKILLYKKVFHYLIFSATVSYQYFCSSNKCMFYNDSSKLASQSASLIFLVLTRSWLKKEVLCLLINVFSAQMLRQFKLKLAFSCELSDVY